MQPKKASKEYEGIDEAHYAYRVRDRLRKEVLVPLRKVLKSPEIYMSANQWNVLPYTRVTSIAMRNYKELFLEHDKKRFQEYLDNVKHGKKKIAAGALLPHEIIASLDSGESGQVVELQWQRIVNDLSMIGKLKNCLTICDVSGSMYGVPLEVSVALRLLVSELSEEPWKGKLITFSHDPQLHVIEGDTLLSKVQSIERMNWSMNTDFQKVFDKILEVANKGKLSEEQMIKRLCSVIWSLIKLLQILGRPTMKQYVENLMRVDTNQYRKFWNLRNSDATPVPSCQKGVALVSGFSKNLLKMFLEEGGVLSPESTMELAIAGGEYSKLVVID
ncbi:Uncharacterized protein L728 [Camellia lanceoleosa]|uniref:Uncharacterized protein L728 n=1 Tax=Camellia lanceoleosa TaxID=1840588 RepID=A0ACC0G5C1_9ERIC|nr:Uncharacterized protein L728 [Camellia lanceoleosa]